MDERSQYTMSTRAGSPRRAPSSMEYTPAGFFVFRTPLLAMDELLAWGADLAAPACVDAGGEDGDAALEAALARDRALLGQRMAELVARPEIRDALFVASPGLVDSVPSWERDGASKRGRKIERGLVRYLARMMGRATPFGLCAGCSLGVAGDDSELVLASRREARRHTRLDMEHVCAVIEALAREPAVRESLSYEPSSGLCRAPGALRYAEARFDGRERSYHLVQVARSAHIDAALARARRGATIDEIAGALVDMDPELSREEARAFVHALIDSQLLVSDLEPCVTGDEPVPGLAERLRRIPAARATAATLEEVSVRLRDLDQSGPGADPRRYREIARSLEALPAPVEMARLFQVDLIRPAPAARLDRDTMDEIVRGVELLHRITPPDTDRLAAFRAAFRARYELREVPLVEALDEESGIGFEVPAVSGESPLLADIPFPPPAPPPAPAAAWQPQSTHLLGLLGQALARGDREIRLGARDLDALARRSPEPLGDSIYACASLARSASGEVKVWLVGAFGPSGVALLTRFCHADPELCARVRDFIAVEREQRPGAVLAEIVHLPEGRMGNILARPVLRDHEIPYLGRSGIDTDHRLPIDDLMISIPGERIVLRSARLDREVIPCLTSAHNFEHPSNLGVYRFLCFLHRQSRGAATWRWGPLRDAPFLPRVSAGRLILSLARWRLSARWIAALSSARGAARYRLARRMRRELDMPRFVAVGAVDGHPGQSGMPVDLDSVLAVDSLAHMLKGKRTATLAELFPAPGDDDCLSLARGPEGRYMNEVILPLLGARREARPAVTPRDKTPPVTPRGQTPPATPRGKTPATPRGQTAPATRSFAPGSEWLYVKVYTGARGADEVIRRAVAPVARRCLARGLCDRWFFLRYADPELHVRARYRGDPRVLLGEVYPALDRALAPLRDEGWPWRVVLDTYEREIERYGGAGGVVLCEALFEADSEASARVIESLSGDAGLDARWRLALLGMHLLLEDLGLDLGARLDLARRARRAFARELGVNAYMERVLGERFRAERLGLEALLDPAYAPAHAATPELAAGIAALRERSRAIAPIGAKLRACRDEGGLTVDITNIAESVLHMHANRVLRSDARVQEMVLYDLLARLYEGRVARERGATRPGGRRV